MTTAVAAESETRQPRALPDKRFLAWLTPILVVALAVRVGFVLIRQSSVQLVTGDAYWYHFQAKLVAQGRGFLNPFDFYKEGIVSQGADHPPGFVVVLTILDWLGIDSPQGQRLVMCLLGTVSVAVIAFLGRRLGGVRVGLIAAAIAALYPNMWINDGMLMVETVFILATAVALLGCYRYVSRPNRVDVAVISLALTVAAMTRPEAILLFLLLPVPIVLGRREVAWKERVLQLVLASCIPILAFAPWVLYNQSRFEDPVFISTGAGQTLAAGNCDLTFSGVHLGFYDTKCLLAPQIQEPTTTDRSLRDSEYREIARSYIGAHSSELPKVMAARVGRVWHLFRVDQSVGLDGFIEGRAGGAPGSGFFLVREALWAYFVLVPLAIYGLVALRRRRTLVYPLLMQPALVTLVAAMTFGITRYRAGAEVTIVVCAAVAIEIIANKLFPPRTPEVQPLPTAQPEVTT
ncbi:Dolichyl-phosphate-mannose-protein mannosyltransferase [Actinobacteria bacterium IMCC26207]|nr:Dolichyl-phosphate-mannose-protein mannosyltransferase [Actinobacteria bacterium IMCC26207]